MIVKIYTEDERGERKETVELKVSDEMSKEDLELLMRPLAVIGWKKETD